MSETQDACEVASDFVKEYAIEYNDPDLKGCSLQHVFDKLADNDPKSVITQF